MVRFEELRAISRMWFSVRRCRDKAERLLEVCDSPVVGECRDSLYEMEKLLLFAFKNMTKGHPVWKWVRCVRGMGEAAAVAFLGEINPELCSSAGKGGVERANCSRELKHQASWRSPRPPGLGATGV